MTDKDRLAELAAAATPGPWSVEGGYLKAGAAALTTVADMRYKNADANRDFIVALVNAYRDGSLVDKNRELRAALDETQRMLESQAERPCRHPVARSLRPPGRRLVPPLRHHLEQAEPDAGVRH